MSPAIDTPAGRIAGGRTTRTPAATPGLLPDPLPAPMPDPLLGQVPAAMPSSPRRATHGPTNKEVQAVTAVTGSTPPVRGSASLVDVGRLTRIRRRDPAAVARAWAGRRRRPVFEAATPAPGLSQSVSASFSEGPSREQPADERLLIVAADHMARGALGVRSDSAAMASRPDVLDRIAVALSRPGVDGVLGTPDVLEDLLLAGLLDDKVVIGSMNRGGLQGAAFELDDRFTAYRARDIAAYGLEGGKMLTRIGLDDTATASTLEATASAVTELAEARVMAMVEPFWSVREGDRVRNLLDAESVIKSIHVASGLGATSAYTWLKLPVIGDATQMRRVLEATTLPALLLGGDPQGDPEQTYSRWRDALQAPTSAGLVVGRALLYPPDGDVAAAVDIAADLVHG